MAREELYIEDANGIFQLVDLPAGQVAINFQEVNLLKMDSLFSNYSQNIKLPKTQRNCDVFSNIDLFDIQSDYANKRHRCLYYVDGKKIIGDNYVFILSKVSENFEGQIIAVVDIFSLLNDTKITDLDLGLQLERSVSAKNNQENYSWYKFANALFCSGLNPNSVPFEFTLPFLKLTEILKKSLTQIGYTFHYPVGKDYYFPIQPKRKQAVGYSGELINPTYVWEIDRKVSGSHMAGGTEYSEVVTTTSSVPNNLGGTISVGEVSISSFVTNIVATYKMRGLYLRIIAKTPAKVVVHVELEGNAITDTNTDVNAEPYKQLHIVIAKKSDITNDNGTLSKDKILYGDNILNSTVENHFNEEGIEFEVERDVEYLVLGIAPIGKRTGYVNGTLSYIWYGNATLSGTVSILPSFDEDEAYAGEQIDIEKSIPVETCGDLLKLYRMAKGSVVRIDEASKTVRIDEIGGVLSYGGALNWSAKLVINKSSMVMFKSDFGRNNYIKLLENSDTKETDKVNITLDNETAALEHDIMTIGTETTRDATLPALNTIHTVDLVTYEFHYDEDYKETVEKKEFGMRLVTLDAGTAKRVSASAIADGAYKPLFERIFSKLRIVEATFMLDEWDVANFDQLKPVYIEYYGAYFFVNKISNWMAGKPCKVELIKI
jgi:hypothetical protein